MHLNYKLLFSKLNQYNIGRRGCELMLSLLKANRDRQAGRQAGTGKYRDVCASKNTL